MHVILWILSPVMNILAKSVKISVQCQKTMLKSDTSSVLSFEPAVAKDALLGSTGYTTQSGPGSAPIELTVTINSIDTPSIFYVSFQATGIEDVAYYFKSGPNGEPLEPQNPSTVGTTATVVDRFSSPVSANTIVFQLTPSAPNSDVVVSGLYVEACYTPGEIIIIIIIHSIGENYIFQ